MRPVDRHPKYRTELCKTFWEQGTCPYGKRCCFIHTFKDDINNENLISSKLMESKIIKQLNTPTSTPISSHLTLDTKSNYLLNNRSGTPNSSRLTTASITNNNNNTNNINNNQSIKSSVNVSRIINIDSKMNVNAKIFEPTNKNKLINPSLQNAISTPQKKNSDDFSDLSTGSTLYSTSSSLPFNNPNNGGSSNGNSDIFSTNNMSSIIDHPNNLSKETISPFIINF